MKPSAIVKTLLPPNARNIQNRPSVMTKIPLPSSQCLSVLRLTVSSARMILSALPIEYGGAESEEEQYHLWDPKGGEPGKVIEQVPVDKGIFTQGHDQCGSQEERIKPGMTVASEDQRQRDEQPRQQAEIIVCLAKMHPPPKGIPAPFSSYLPLPGGKGRQCPG